MGFLGVYRALYDYTPQNDQELSLTEGDLLLVLEKSSKDEWWKCKKKIPADDGEEPLGLVPSNYIEEVGVLTMTVETIEFDWGGNGNRQITSTFVCVTFI